MTRFTLRKSCGELANLLLGVLDVQKSGAKLLDFQLVERLTRLVVHVSQVDLRVASEYNEI
jgi:hypothetical protein